MLSDEEADDLMRAYAIQGERDGEALGHWLLDPIVEEIKMAFVSEAVTAMDQGKTFEEWLYGEDPHARFIRLVKASSAPRWLVENWIKERERD